MSAAASVQATLAAPASWPGAASRPAAAPAGSSGAASSARPDFVGAADGGRAPRAAATLATLLRTTRRVAAVGLGTGVLGLGAYVGLPTLLPGLVAVGSLGKYAVLGASWACVLGACTFLAAASAWAVLRLVQAAATPVTRARTGSATGPFGAPLARRPAVATAARPAPAAAPRPRAPLGEPPTPPAPEAAAGPARPPARPNARSAAAPSTAADGAIAVAPAALTDAGATGSAQPRMPARGAPPQSGPPSDAGTVVCSPRPSAPASEAPPPPSSAVASSRSNSPGTSAQHSPARSLGGTSPLGSPFGSSLPGLGWPPEGARQDLLSTPSSRPRSPSSENSPGGSGGSGSDAASAQAFYTPLAEPPRDGAPSEEFAFAAPAQDLDPEAEQLAEANAHLRSELEELTAQLAEQRGAAALAAVAQRGELASLDALLGAANAQLAALTRDLGLAQADVLAHATERDALRAELADVHAQHDALVRGRLAEALPGTVAERRRQAQRQRAREEERDAERELAAQITGRLHELEGRSKLQAGEIRTLRARQERQQRALAEREVQVDELQQHLEQERRRRSPSAGVPRS